MHNNRAPFQFRSYSNYMHLIKAALCHATYSMRQKNVSRFVRFVQLFRFRFVHLPFTHRSVIVFRSLCFGPFRPLRSVSHRRFHKFCPRSRCGSPTCTYLRAASHSARTTAALWTVVYRSTLEKVAPKFQVRVAMPNTS